MLNAGQKILIKELVTTHVLAQTFAPTGLDHEVPGQVGGGSILKGAEHNTLIKRVPRDNGPVVKYTQAEGGALSKRVG